jgi:hypothetical protein
MLATTYRNSDRVEPDPEADAARAAWLAARCGKLTGSRMNDACDFNKDGRPSKKRSDYMRDLLAERLTGYSIRHFVTGAMEWGTMSQPDAIARYCQLKNCRILPEQFVEHNTIENFGATPDGFIGDDGLLEVKAPTTGTFVQWVLNKTVPEEHKLQMLAQLACTRRSYVDFFAYDPRIKEESKRYFLRRFEPTRDEIMIVEEHAIRFLDELEKLWEAFVTA